MERNFENCGYYIDDECTICGMGADGEDTFCKYCKDNPNCYYKQLVELKAENERLRDNIKSISQPVLLPDVPIEVTNKYKQTLQEIKEIAMGIMDDDTEESSAYSDARQIINLITKTESEGE